MEKIPHRTNHPLLSYTKYLFALTLLCPLGNLEGASGTVDQAQGTGIIDADESRLGESILFSLQSTKSVKKKGVVYIKKNEENSSSLYQIDVESTKSNNAGNKEFLTLLKTLGYLKNIFLWPTKKGVSANFDIVKDANKGLFLAWLKQALVGFLEVPFEHVKNLNDVKGTFLEGIKLDLIVNDRGEKNIREGAETPFIGKYYTEALRVVSERIDKHDGKPGYEVPLKTSLIYVLAEVLKDNSFQKVHTEMKAFTDIKSDSNGNEYTEFQRWKKGRAKERLEILRIDKQNEASSKNIKVIMATIFKEWKTIATTFSLIGAVLIAAYFLIMFIYRQGLKAYATINIKEDTSVAPSWFWHPMQRWRWNRKPKRAIVPKKNIILTKEEKYELDAYIETVKDALDHNKTLTREQLKNGEGWTVPFLLNYGPTGSGKTLVALDYIVGSLRAIAKYRDRVDYTVYGASAIVSADEGQVMETLKEDHHQREQAHINKAGIHFVVVNEIDELLQNRYSDKTSNKMKAVTVDFLDRYPVGSSPSQPWIGTTNVIADDLSQLRHMDEAALNRFALKLFSSPFGKKKLAEMTLEEVQEVIGRFNKVFLVWLESFAITRGVKKKGDHIKNYAELKNFVENEFYALIKAYPSYREVRNLAEKIAINATRKQVRARRKLGGGKRGRREVLITEDDLREAFDKEKILMKQKGIQPLNLEDYGDKEETTTTVQKEADNQTTINTKVEVIQNASWAISLMLFILILILTILMAIALVQSPLWPSLKKMFKKNP